MRKSAAKHIITINFFSVQCDCAISVDSVNLTDSQSEATTRPNKMPAFRSGTEVATPDAAHGRKSIVERKRNMKPVARRDDLVVKRDTGELFIEDIVNKKYIYLNPTSAYVWEKCDGQRDATQIADEMGTDLGVSVSERVVQMAVKRLEGERLVFCV